MVCKNKCDHLPSAVDDPYSSNYRYCAECEKYLESKYIRRKVFCFCCNKKTRMKARCSLKNNNILHNIVVEARRY